jgi:hypothetical protein
MRQKSKISKIESNNLKNFRNSLSEISSKLEEESLSQMDNTLFKSFSIFNSSTSLNQGQGSVVNRSKTICDKIEESGLDINVNVALDGFQSYLLTNKVRKSLAKKKTHDVKIVTNNNPEV